MSDRTEAAIAVLALAAAGLVMGAPLLGRAGMPLVADAAMASAALCGAAAFVLAGIHTLRAARRGGLTPETSAESPVERVEPGRGHP